MAMRHIIMVSVVQEKSSLYFFLAAPFKKSILSLMYRERHGGFYLKQGIETKKGAVRRLKTVRSAFRKSGGRILNVGS